VSPQDPKFPGTDHQPTTSNTDEPPAAYSEANAKALGKPPIGSEAESKTDSVEGKPGIIEGTELAPLGEEKQAEDRVAERT
jgi:hypothetical protein